MRCSCDDPPDVNCRNKSYSAADHLINPLLGLAGFNGGARNNVNSRKQVASRLLESFSESPNLEPDKLAQSSADLFAVHSQAGGKATRNSRTFPMRELSV
jgi:hypothetical protein